MMYEFVNARLQDRRQGGKAPDSVYCKPAGTTTTTTTMIILSRSSRILVHRTSESI
jgi:hypothetical protein